MNIADIYKILNNVLNKNSIEISEYKIFPNTRIFPLFLIKTYFIRHLLRLTYGMHFLVYYAYIGLNDILLFQDVKGPQTVAFNLPNDERIVKDRGTSMVMLKNVSEAK